MSIWTFCPTVCAASWAGRRVHGRMPDFAALKALVVEDEGAVALLIEDMLGVLGCEIVASVAQIAPACRLAEASPLDFAVLDVNLDGQPVFAVARILQERRIPFFFSTGYGA